MRILSSLLLLLISLSVFSQSKPTYSTKSKKAIKLYEQSKELSRARNIDGAIASLEQAVAVDPNFVEAHYSLAEQIHLFYSIQSNQSDKLIMHYEKVVELTTLQPKYARVYYQLGKIYFDESKFDQSLSRLQMVIDNPDAKEKYLNLALKLYANCEFAKQAVIDSLPITLEPLPREINFATFHSYPVLIADNSKMIYTVKGGSGRSNDENIYVSEYAAGKWQPSKEISANINTPLNEGTATISGDGKTLVFTGCNRRNSVGGCDLYITHKKGDDWEKPQNMGILVNSHGWEAGPSLSADGRTLYFSSRREHGEGKADIWITTLSDDGDWSKPVNAGPTVNTKEEDVTPFIHANGRDLFFASTGHVGMGGYDLFRAIKNNDGVFEEAKNLGYPINTQDNEGALFVTSDYSKGYFEKVVRQGMASYGILYSFDIPKDIQAKQKTIYAKGRVHDSKTEESLGARVELYDLITGKRFERVFSDSINGSYMLVLNEGDNYALHARKKGYMFYSKNFAFEKADDFKSMVLDIPLVKIEPGAKIALRNVFFESGKYDLDDKSNFELNKVVELLEQNKVSIEISGHTDNVGSETANKTLSLNRAKSVYSYLVSKGISKDRLSYKGFGEQKPEASNDTDEGRSLNRRIEIRIK